MRSVIVLLISLLPLLGYSVQANQKPIEVTFSKHGGFYKHAFTVQLDAPVGCTIYYTLDGAQPDHHCQQYQGPINVNQTQVIRAIAYRGTDRSPIYAQTYWMDAPKSTLPVVALSVAPWHLFDPKEGLFMLGSQADLNSSRLSGANFWSRKEVAANLEIYSPDGTQELTSAAGLRLFGGMSRLFPQKSMAVVARNLYGAKKFDHSVFGKKGLKDFKFLILRNSGSDFGKSHLRDAFITQAVRDWELEVQDYEPAHLYINGTYWGIYNLREKINRHFLADHQEVDKDSIDLLEHYMTRKTGSIKHYRRLLQFLETNDLSNSKNYAQVQQWMDVDNFIDYQIAQIFFDNRDAGGNIRFWRPQTPDGRWRWILYDTDWGVGLHDQEAYLFNSLEFHTQADGADWPNPPWSTFLLRKLLENDAFKQRFIRRFSDHLNTSLRSDVLLGLLDEMYERLVPEMPRHLERWNLSGNHWERHINIMRKFLEERPTIMWEHLAQYFAFAAPNHLNLNCSLGGTVLVNNHKEIPETSFGGKYFSEQAIRLRAIPELGYRFSHWEVDGKSIDDYEIILQVEQAELKVKAVFEKYNHPLLGKLMFNEICPYDKQTKDWVELFNKTRKRIWLEGYSIRDAKGHVFRFPSNSYVDPNDYIVVCQKLDKFKKQYPEAYNVVGGLNFGISKQKESLELFEHNRSAVDLMQYTIEPVDSAFSLSLILPHLDNGQQENWHQAFDKFSPNMPNTYYVESRVRRTQTWWMQLGCGIGALFLALGFGIFSLRQRR